MNKEIKRLLVGLALVAITATLAIINQKHIGPDEAALWILNNDTHFTTLRHKYIKVSEDSVAKYQMLPYLEALEEYHDYTIEITLEP